MIKYLSLILILTIQVSQINGLSLKKISHYQSTNDLTIYLNQLISIQNTLQNMINILEQNINSINSNVSNFEGYINIQTQILEQGITDQRQQLYNINNQLILPLNQRVWNCQLLTDIQVNKINQEISDTQKNIQLLKQKLVQQAQCQKNNQIQLQIQFLNMYMNHLANQTGSNCGINNTTPNIIYVPNSQNNFYVYGGQTQQGYLNNLQNLLNQGYTKVQCPVTAPYPSGNFCVNCAQDGLHYYDLTTLQCLACQNGYIFQTQSRTCVTQTFNSNPSANNYIGSFPGYVIGANTCPINTPFFNGVSCIGCSDLWFFNFAKLVCQTCQSNTVFDPSTHLCVYKKYNTNVSPNTTNYCCGTLPYDPTAESCPASTPFFNGQQCISCLIPAYFSLQTMSCILCPQAQGFSLIQRQCIDNKYLQPIYTSGISSDVTNYQGTPPQVDPMYEKVTQCPSISPFFNGQTCISCPLPYYFNFQSNNCEVCAAEMKFDVNLKQCVQLSTNQMNNNMAAMNNYMGTIPNFNSSLATCPTSQPFFNGNQCITCTLPNFVNFNTLSCTTCNINYTFNIYNKQCVIATPNSYTNINANNIFYNGDFNTVKSQIESQKQQFPGITQCPIQIPYYDWTQGICITCPSNYPLFDYKFNKCTACAGQSKYNPTSRICILGGRVSATLERMIMNTIGWS